MSEFSDNVAVITGAASGIGLAVARAMIAEGADVVGLDVERGPSDVQLLACDVTDPASVDRAFDDIRRAHDRIDILVTAAGIWRGGTVVDATLESWDAVLDVNLRGVFLTSRAALGAMTMRKRGSVVHIASVAGLVGGRGSAAYCASKGAVVALTRAMALDHAPVGVRVNCVCPGMTRTPMLDATEAGLSPDEVERLRSARASTHPLGRLGTPEDIVPAVLYLAGERSAWVTGSVMTVDGGYLAG